MLSIRSLSLAALAIFGLLVAALAVGLPLLSLAARQSSQSVADDIRGAAASQEIERLLHEDFRLSNLWAAARDRGVLPLRDAADDDLQRVLAAMPAYVGGALEARLLANLEAQIGRYLVARRALEAQRAPLAQMVQALRPPFDAALEAGAALKAQNEADLRLSNERVASAIRYQAQAATAAALLVLVGLALTAFGVRRLLVQPMVDLHAAMARFRGGDTRAAAHGGCLREIGDLAGGFNAMVASIAAQRSDQATFLAAVAHELRNPLSVAVLLTHVIQKEPHQAPARAAQIEKQLARINRLVGDLLDAAQIESGNLELKPEAFDLRAVVQGVVDLYQASSARHQLELAAPPQAVTLVADPLRIEQVVGNLVSNAIKYSPGGGPVSVVLEAAAGTVTVAVTDCGRGMSAAEIANLFVPFRRAPDLADSIPGSGLGLSIVQRIVNAHGGRIDVESTPGAGSVFRVRLPRQAKEKPA